MKIISVVGARPNFIKISPFIKSINKYNSNNTIKVEHLLVHTGQHYDDRMSKSFFESLNIPYADINLGIGSGSHAEQVGRTMIAFEKVLLVEKPDWVVVVGDVNATLACSVTAKKLHIKVCHIEAGLRSRDNLMPEEINRLVTDRLSDLLLVPDELSVQNLLKEGVEKNKIKFVGNIMIDTLLENKKTSLNLNFNEIISKNSISTNNGNIKKNNFILTTLHRPSNVDSKKNLNSIVDFFLNEISILKDIVWPIHPRTVKQLKLFQLWDALVENPKIHLLHPIGYHELLNLNINSKLVLTDSGGLQEECTVSGTPCITLRSNTERPITLVENGGVSVLVVNDIPKISKEYNKALKITKKPIQPKYWDGKTAERCLKKIINF